MCKNNFILKLLSFLFVSFAINAGAVSIDSDSRITTLVYDENDVFTVHTQSGFQTDIELAPNETIDTISIGDSFGWQVTPATKRIFIKPLQKSGITNLSVITNKRSYQFELIATPPGSREGHAYVVKFYYPGESHNMAGPVDRSRASTRPISPTAIPELPGTSYPGGVPEPPPVPVMPQMPGTSDYQPPAPVGKINGSFNYNYTLTGPDSAAPTKIYDDGKSTYFEFRTLPNALFSSVGANGQEMSVATKIAGPNSIVVNGTAAKFIIRDANNNVVTVYNENMRLPQIPTSRAH